MFRIRLTHSAPTAKVALVAPVDSFIQEYGRRFSQRDVEGVTDLCMCPFLAVRRGEAIHLPDRSALRDHYASEIKAYQLAAQTAQWRPVEIEARALGEYSVYVSVHWNALDRHEQLVRDTWTSYQLLAADDGWKMLSYTNHF
jgi:hypothetical protein